MKDNVRFRYEAIGDNTGTVPVEQRGRLAAPSFRPAPADINTNAEHFWNAFGNTESERAAKVLCRVARRNGDWRAVTLDQILAVAGGSSFDFERLIKAGRTYDSRGRGLAGGGWVVAQPDGVYSFTEEFVLRCHLSSHGRSRELRERFPNENGWRPDATPGSRADSVLEDFADGLRGELGRL